MFILFFLQQLVIFPSASEQSRSDPVWDTDCVPDLIHSPGFDVQPLPAFLCIAYLPFPGASSLIARLFSSAILLLAKFRSIFPKFALLFANPALLFANPTYPLHSRAPSLSDAHPNVGERFRVAGATVRL